MESNNDRSQWSLEGPGYAETSWTDGPMLVADDPLPIEVPVSPVLDAVPGAVLTEAELPESRIRFTAPAELRIEGLDDSVPAAVLNLSRGGVALVGDCELTPGQRLWARFRLGLTDEPVDYLCAVAWRKSEGRQNLYGCEFSSLTEEETRSLDRLVEARTRGLETEWSTPEPLEFSLDPASAEPEVSESRPPRRSLMWGLGLLAGFAVAIFAGRAVGSLLFDATDTEAVEVAERLPIRIGTEEPEAVEDEEIAVAPAPALPDEDVGPEEGAASEPATTAAPEVEAAASADGAQALLADTRRGVTVELKADGPVETYTSFWLENPKRFVVDVQGRDSGLASPSESFAHPLVSRLRVGRHPDKVRYVLEVASQVTKVEAAKIEGNSIWVELIRSAN
ncbi:MAG: PilZ domain-containing protein [Myxococcota bacterium]